MARWRDTSVVTVTAATGASLTAADNASAIQSAIDGVSVLGGGTVHLPPGTFNVSGDIQLKSGVSIVGARPTLTYTSNAPLFLDEVNDGTWLVGPGSGTCFIHNATDDTGLGASWVNTAYFAEGKRNDGTTVYCDPALSNVSLVGIGFSGWDRGFKVGAVNKIGADSFEVLHCRFIDCATWAGEIHNSWYVVMQHNRGSDSRGFAQYASVPVATVSPGQAYYVDNRFNMLSGDYQGQGLVYAAIPCGSYSSGVFTDTTAQINQPAIDAFLCMAFGRTAITQSATFSSSSTDITVTDGTKFPVGMSLVFTGGTLGAAFNTNFVYGRVVFVVYQSGNNIRVANTIHGSAITSGGTTSATASTYGKSLFQFTAPAAGGCTNVTLKDCEAEGQATTGFLFDNVTNMRAEVAPLMTSAHASVTRRNVRQGKISVAHNITSVPVLDDDSATLQGSWLEGQTNDLNYNGGSNGYPTPGWRYYNAGGTWDMRFNSGGGLRGMVTSGGPGWLRPFKGMGQANTQRNTSASPLSAFAGLCVFNGATGQTFTLPTITGDASTGHVGMPFWVVNTSANNLTVSTDGTQTFNGVSAKTSMTIAANSAVLIQGAQASGSVNGDSNGYFWAVLAYQVGASLP